MDARPPLPRPTLPTAPRRRRRRAAAACLGLTVAVLACPPRAAGAGEPTPAASTREARLDADRRLAVRRGCDWLASRQNRGGSFGDDKAPVAFTALSMLALLAGGSGMDRGPHGAVVQEAATYLLTNQQKPDDATASHPTGYYHAISDANSRMHGHGYAMLALATALASAGEHDAARIRASLRAAVRCAESSQTLTGGWGYNPTPAQDHEGSVTVTVAQGLRAAHDVGIPVRSDVVARGLRYLRQSQKPDGSFKYSIQQDVSTYALTAAAVSSFLLLGRYAADEADGDAKRILDGVDYLRRSLRDVMVRKDWYFYGHFYAAWSAWQIDGNDVAEDGPRASGGRARFYGPWHATVFRALIDQQHPATGAWHDEDDRYRFDDVVATSFAVLTLAIPDEELPIFQR